MNGKLAIGLGVLLAAAVAARRRTLSAVAPELRTPRIWLPLAVGGRVTLAAGRWWYGGETEPVDGVRVVRYRVPHGQDVFVHRPERQEGNGGGALLWIHGGGTVLGRPHGDQEWCSRIARELGIVVVNAEYRLAPEHPFPAGFDDCWAALGWLHDQAAELGVDTGRIAVAGASAGGGLAAAVVQKARDEGVPVACQVLIYPMLDDRTVLRRDQRGRGWIGWTPRSNRYAWRSYLGPDGAARPGAAAGRRENLAGLPPTWIGVGTLDLFHDEDLAYAERLRRAGVPVMLVVEPGMYHGADRFRETAPAMREFRRSMLDAIAAGVCRGRRE